MMTDRIYYDDQSAWQLSDYYALYCYFNGLAEYVRSTAAQRADPGHRSARIRAKKMRVRDDELAAIDMPRMSTEMLRLQGCAHLSRRCTLALERFPNLLAVEQATQPAKLVGFDQCPTSVKAQLWLTRNRLLRSSLRKQLLA